MGKHMKHLRRCISLGMLLVLLFLQGCGSDTKIDPSAKAIAEKSSAAGFLATLTEQYSGFIGSDKKTEQAYLYDNAIALYVLSEAGASWHAEKLADAIVYAQEHDRTFHDGRLRNVYLCGDPSVDSGRSVAKGTVPLPGFWQNGRWQEDYYSVSTSAGNMAWTILALCKASEVVPEAKGAEYTAAAEKAADFLLDLAAPGGGFTAGYEGWDEVQKKVVYQSTEHNIALTVAFSVLAEVINETSPQKADAYRAAAESAREFVLSMYDPDLCCFYTGTEEDGKTINVGVVPLDATALSILAFGNELENVQQMLAFVEKNIAVGAGFDFSAGDLDGIWNEGTAQMALCYWNQERTEEYNAILGYLKTQEYKDGGVPAADRDGVSTGFVLSGTEELWEYNNTLSIGATGWYALAQMKVNPLEKD
ncbi:MAG: hypothetical protein ACSW8H_00550 [bacterium]|jgi:hypothetical protein